MVTLDCPWCEAELGVGPEVLEAPELACSDCGTAWLIGDERAAELPLAA